MTCPEGLEITSQVNKQKQDQNGKEVRREDGRPICADIEREVVGASNMPGSICGFRTRSVVVFETLVLLLIAALFHIICLSYQGVQLYSRLEFARPRFGTRRLSWSKMFIRSVARSGVYSFLCVVAISYQVGFSSDGFCRFLRHKVPQSLLLNFLELI